MRPVRLTLRRALIASTVVAAVGATGACTNDGEGASGRAPRKSPATVGAPLSGVAIDVRNDPGCNCCTSWVEYLREHGATVELSEDADRDSFRDGRGISDEAASCHTAIVNGYAVEGHVPVGAIARLLRDRPEAAGLALPGMPADGPGMGGDARTWEAQPVMLVTDGGDLTPFEY